MKKGLVYTALALLLTVAALTALIIMVTGANKKIAEQGDVGAKATAVTEANQKANDLKIHEKRKAIQSTIQAIQEIHEKTETEKYALKTPCGRYEEIPVWYNNTECSPTSTQILNGIERSIKQKMPEYEITIIPGKETTIIGTKLQPILAGISIPGRTENARILATIAIDTSFEITIPYETSAIIKTAEQAEEIKKCNTDECLKQTHPTLTKRTDGTDKITLYEFSPAMEIKMPGLKLRPIRFAIIED